MRQKNRISLYSDVVEKLHQITLLLPIDYASGPVPPACGSFTPSENRVHCPHCSTCVRGFCHGLSSLLLPAGADRLGVAVPHAPLGVAQRPHHVSTAISAYAPKAKAPS